MDLIDHWNFIILPNLWGGGHIDVGADPVGVFVSLHV